MPTEWRIVGLFCIVPLATVALCVLWISESIRPRFGDAVADWLDKVFG